MMIMANLHQLTSMLLLTLRRKCKILGTRIQFILTEQMIFFLIKITTNLVRHKSGNGTTNLMVLLLVTDWTKK